MRHYDELSETIQYAMKKHSLIQQRNKGGYGTLFLRKPDGRRILIQELRYFRIFKYEIIDYSSLVLYNIITGLAFRGKKLQSATSVFHLNDLLCVNVYDHMTHFISDTGVDFAYTEENDSIAVESLQHLLLDQYPTLRAQWFNKNASVDQVLNEATVGRSVKLEEPYRRYVAMDYDKL